MKSRRATVILHLVATWFLYNVSLFFVLVMTCRNFDYNEYVTMAAMAIFSIGINVMQYDMWNIRRNKLKRSTQNVGD